MEIMASCRSDVDWISVYEAEYRQCLPSSLPSTVRKKRSCLIREYAS